jgi:hypothetical protein
MLRDSDDIRPSSSQRQLPFLWAIGSREHPQRSAKKPRNLGRSSLKVLVFVGASQAKIPFELAAAMQRLGDDAQYVKIGGNGKNALDFHLAFYVGELVAKDPEAYFHILSKDTGFDPLIKRLKTRKVRI